MPGRIVENASTSRQAERELAANGLDVLVARAHFFPRLDISASVGYQAFNPRYLFDTPEALIANAAGNLAVPLLNKKAIQAEYMTANAKQLESVYEYQRVILSAFTEVINLVSAVDKYGKSIDIKKLRSWSHWMPRFGKPPPSYSRMLALNTWKCCWPSETSRKRRWS